MRRGPGSGKVLASTGGQGPGAAPTDGGHPRGGGEPVVQPTAPPNANERRPFMVKRAVLMVLAPSRAAPGGGGEPVVQPTAPPNANERRPFMVKRAVLMVLAALVAAALMAPAALAVTKQCSERPCLGTTNDDRLK